MDVQITDQNGKGGNVMQHYELERVLNYAEKWAEISNNVVDNNFVMSTISSIRGSIEKWRNKKKKTLRPEGTMSLSDDFELEEAYKL